MMLNIELRVWDKGEKVMMYMSNGIEVFDDMIGFRLPTLFPFSEDIRIMQWSGEKDVEGIKIYEGDIIEYYDAYVYNHDYAIIEFSEGSFLPISEPYCVDINVLGNVYENKDLIKKYDLEFGNY